MYPLVSVIADPSSSCLLLPGHEPEMWVWAWLNLETFSTTSSMLHIPSCPVRSGSTQRWLGLAINEGEFIK